MTNRHDISLTFDSLFDAARLESGVDDFEDDGFLARARIVIEAYRNCGLSHEGQVRAAESILDVMVTRINLSDDRRRYPEIADEKIETPIVVGGLPRSGTSFLYYILASDPAAMTPHWWDALHPSPPVGLSTEYNRLRKQIAQREVAEYVLSHPDIKKAHSYFVNGANMSLECYMLWGLDFRGLAPFLFFRAPVGPQIKSNSALEDLMSDMVATYQFERSLLQNLQWKRSAGHWVLKDPTHHFYLPELFSVFPDCTFVWPHRDPASVFASVVEVTEIMLGREHVKKIGKRALAQSILDNFTKRVERIIGLPIVDSPNVIHVHYQDFVMDPVKTAEAVYHRMGRTFSDDMAHRINNYTADKRNRSDYYGKFKYELSETGLTADEVRSAFGKYISRFNIKMDE